jgi:malate permease and related proteins
VIVALVLLLLGVVAARLPAVPERTPATLDVLVLWFALPGLILVEVPRLQLGVETLVPVAVAWGTTLLAIVVVLVLGRLRGWSRRTIGTMLLVVPLGNTSFLGIPAVSALLGSSHLGQALVYDQVGNFVAFVTWGTFVAARYGDGGTPTLGGTVRRILVFPPFVALLVALVIREGVLTGTVLAVVNDVAGALGATLIPLTMLAIGMRLDLPRRWHTFEPMVAGLVVRMGLARPLPTGLWCCWMAAGSRGKRPSCRRPCRRWSPPRSWRPRPAWTRNWPRPWSASACWRRS